MDIFHKKADQNSHVDVINLCKFNKCMLSLGYALKIRFFILRAFVERETKLN